ncbi:unnamed protein product [Caenorhabditis sp. 36 PRJEB53466]|nr:unnamed protein product [Caenorhabditis sp. 36 PRJEB53466]
MPLRFDRFRHFPESGKTATLFLSALLGFLLSFADLHYKNETKFFWASFWLSFLFDVVTILILLKDWDENVDWLRKAPFSLYHCIGSLAVSFLMFVCGILFLLSESYSGDGVLYVGAFFCLLIFAIRMACILKMLPQLKMEVGFPERPSNADYENHGTSIV